jgi:hypothetical protein
MKKIKCVSISQDIFSNLEEDFQRNLKISELQSYFPIMALFFKVFNNSDRHFTLKTNNYLTKINSKINFEANDSYIKHFFECDIKNYNSNKITNKKVFVKILPILNVTQYMMNEYNISSILPNIHSYLTNKKVNNYHNSAYIDSFFSYLGSNLTENGYCPTFPIYYGTFSGIAEEFKYDVSEEYSMMKNEDWFKMFNNNLFTLEKVKINNGNGSPGSSLSDLSLNSDEVDNDSEETNNDELEETNNDDSEETNNDELEETNNDDSEETNNDELEETNNDELDLDSGSDRDSDSNSNSNSKWSDVTSCDSGASNNDYLELKNLKMTKINFDNCNENDSENDSENDRSLSSLSASVCSDNSFQSIANNEISYAKFYNFPVQLNCIEMLDKTLDNYLDECGKISEDEWKSILFQICFGLAVSQKHYNFVHNDLHSSNIMFKNTKLEFIYYNFKGKYFKIPTFGKIVKIIDFGRATFNIGNKIFFSDVFKKNGDAEGQYSYPYTNSLDKCKIKPNKSFDLSRLATTIIQHFEENSPIFKLLKLWASDKNGNFLLQYEDDFNLYKIIAKNVISAVPKNQINKIIFRQFSIEKEDISSNEFVYNY